MSSYRSRRTQYPGKGGDRPPGPAPKAPRDAKEFYELALKYCSRRETSRARMESYLLRKAKGSSRTMEEEELKSIRDAIHNALNQLEKHQVISDERYAGILVRDYQRRAKGERYIKLKLKEKGLDSQINSLEKNEEEELERALSVVDKLVGKARFKKIESRFELKQKLMQRLVASGFDLTLSKKAVALRVR